MSFKATDIHWLIKKLNNTERGIWDINFSEFSFV